MKVVASHGMLRSRAHCSIARLVGHPSAVVAEGHKITMRAQVFAVHGSPLFLAHSIFSRERRNLFTSKGTSALVPARGNSESTAAALYARLHRANMARSVGFSRVRTCVWSTSGASCRKRASRFDILCVAAVREFLG